MILLNIIILIYIHVIVNILVKIALKQIPNQVIVHDTENYKY